ncbi:MAG TPA: hypothetical protein VHI52_10565 [Verrucomicrobiae bacterium]|nr:hypothetical protein [Verrucomicrobiae bacterium]
MKACTFSSGTLRQAKTGNLAVVILCVVCTFEGMVRAAVELTPQRIEEVRDLIFKDDKVSRTPAGLKLVLTLDGPEAESASQYGRLKLDQATDNTGASLIPRTDVFHDPLKFKDYANAFFRNSRFGGKPEKSKPQVEVDLAVPARTASKIARLRGSLELSDGGKTNTVELAELKHAGRKQVPLPNGSPMTLTVEVPAEANVRSIKLESTGDDSDLASVEVVDANGKRVSNGLSSWSVNGGPVQKSLGLSKPLDDSMKLVLEVVSDRKYTKVSFDLNDIPLP